MKNIIDQITSSLKDLNKGGFVDDSAMVDIESLSLSRPSHPGEILKELILEALNITIETASHHLGVTGQILSRIVNGNGSISPEVALRLEMVFGNLSAEQWLSLQNAWDLWQVKKNIPELEIVPFKAMK